MARRGMNFGILLAPFHRGGDTPFLIGSPDTDAGKPIPQGYSERATGARDAAPTQTG